MDTALKSHFLILYCMILADGIIDVRELEVLYKIGIENYGLTPEQISEAVREAGTSYVFPEKVEGRISLLYELAIIAWADGRIEQSERDILRTYALKMGFLDDNIEEIIEYLIEQAKSNIPAQQVIDNIIKS